MMQRHPFLACLLLPLLAPLGNSQCESSRVTADEFSAHQNLGEVIASDGGVFVVGVPAYSEGGTWMGAARVYEQLAGDWVQSALLLASDGEAYDRFGSTVSISGDRIVVGAPFASLPASQAGAAYVFERAGGTWIETARLQWSEIEQDDYFGCAVSVSHDLILVGAWGDDPPTNRGAAFLFEFDGQGWQELQKLSASDGTIRDKFGVAVALDGDRAIIGAWQDDPSGVNNSGSAYIFEAGTSEWEQIAKLKAPGGVQGENFGRSVALDGTRVLVGGNQGTAYLFEGPGSAWPLVDSFSGFGSELAVDIDGDRVVVGGTSGEPVVYTLDGSTWDASHGPMTCSGSSGGGLGLAASLDGPRLFLGAPQDDPMGANSGAIYIYDLDETVTIYCTCEGAGACFNADPIAGCPNSTGIGARLDATGSASVGQDDLLLHVSHMTATQFGLIYMGGAGAEVVFGDGLRCVSAGGVGIFRFPLNSSDSNGGFTQGPGLAAFSAGNFGAAGTIVSGSTWYFQGWYRDTGGPCQTGFNLTNGVAVHFAP